MKRAKHRPDLELPPITGAGTGAPKTFGKSAKQLRRERRDKREKRSKKRRTHSDPAEMTPAQLRERQRNIERMKARGLTPGNPGNSGGKKGRSGRRPDVWKRWCEKLLLNKGTQRAIRRVIRDRNHPAYGTITKMIRDSAFPVTKNVDVTDRRSLEDLLAGTYDA